MRIDVTVAGLPVELAPPFATSVHGGGRYLLDQHGDPWFGVGDTAWSLCIQLTTAEITTYMENRAAKGVNLVLFNAIEHHYGDNPPDNANGDPPFTATAFQSSLDEDYWAVIDHAVAEAERLGITCLICPAYMGFNNTEGWGAELAAASDGQVQAYGEALAARYGTAPNVMWLMGHDREPDATQIARQEALSAGLPVGQLRLPGAYNDTSILQSVSFGSTSISWDVENIYSRTGAGAEDGALAWAASPTRPFLFFEGDYENEKETVPGDVRLREQYWAPTMAGATGAIFGNLPIWLFDTGWESALDDEGSVHLGIFAAFMAGIDWSALTPDTGDTFLVSGELTGSNRAAARFNDQLGLVYMPTSREIQLDLTEIAASSARVRKFDPADGTYTQIDTYATSGNQTIAAPGTNSNGDGDWVIVVEGV